MKVEFCLLFLLVSFLFVGCEKNTPNNVSLNANMEHYNYPNGTKVYIDDNAAFKLSLESMYSLDDIYNVPTNELGMVYAKKGQVVYYESANEDYVKQYQDIPE